MILPIPIKVNDKHKLHLGYHVAKNSENEPQYDVSITWAGSLVITMYPGKQYVMKLQDLMDLIIQSEKSSDAEFKANCAMDDGEWLHGISEGQVQSDSQIQPGNDRQSRRYSNDGS